MPSVRIKTLSASTVTFITMFFLLGFISFSAVLMISSLYRLVTRGVHSGDIRRAGIPALGAIFLVGLFSAIILSPYQFSAWNMGKDIYFFIAPILMLILGVTLIKDPSDFEGVLETAVKTLTIISIVQFSDFLFGGNIFNVSLDTRYTYQLDSTASSLALLLIISLRPTFGSLTGRSLLSVLAFLNMFLIVVSLSRVNIAIALVSLVFVYSHNRLLRSTVLLVTFFLIAAPLFQISAIAQGETISGGFSFLGKALNSFQEFRISDYSDFGEMNENWRGYEAYLGVNQVSSVGGWANLIGVGFGSFAAGPFEAKLSQIPFFHNGFVTVFLKAGFLGVAIFAIFAGKLYLICRSTILQPRSISDPRIASAVVLIFLLTTSMLLRTLSTHGVYYSKTTLELLFIGLSIYVIGRLKCEGAAAQRSHRDDCRVRPMQSFESNRQ